MSTIPPCPKCQSVFTYMDDTSYICPECTHEWPSRTDDQANSDEAVIKDANGNVLHDGDSVTVIKDLKVRGASLVVKVGTKVKKHSFSVG